MPLVDAVSCVLAEDAGAPSTPVADSVRVRRYAVRVRDCEATLTPVTLPVTEEIQRRGRPRRPRAGHRDCIASGAPMPTGRRGRAPRVHRTMGIAQSALWSPRAAGENIRRRAEDVAQGETARQRASGRADGAPGRRGRDCVSSTGVRVVILRSVMIVEPAAWRHPGTVFTLTATPWPPPSPMRAPRRRVAAVPDERARLRETTRPVGAPTRPDDRRHSYGSGDTVREVLGACGGPLR